MGRPLIKNCPRLIQNKIKSADRNVFTKEAANVCLECPFVDCVLTDKEINKKNLQMVMIR